jgi:amino acid permease
MAVKRRMMGNIIIAARFLGAGLIGLAVLGFPAMRFLPAALADTFRWISSIVLMMACIAWLAAVRLFIRFFDQYLSRN